MKKWWFLSIFALWVKKIRLWAKQLCRGLSKLPSACPEEYYEDISLKKGWFSYLFALWAKSLLTSAKYLRQGFRNFNLRVRRKSLREKKWKKDDFLVILYFEWKTLDFGQNNSAGAIKTSFGVSRGIFWAFFIGKTMNFDWNFYFEQKNSGLSQNFTAGFPKLQSMCPEKNCERDKIWKNDDFLVILYFEWKKLDSGQSNWAGCCQNYLRRVWRNMERIFQWKKNDISNFLHFEQNYCWLLPNIYGRVPETSI